MLIALDPAQTFELVPPSMQNDPDAEPFVFRPLTSVDRLEVNSVGVTEPDLGARIGLLSIAHVRRALVSWPLKTPNPRKGEDGQPEFVPCPLERDAGGVSRASLARIPPLVLLELANELYARERVSQADVGKS